MKLCKDCAFFKPVDNPMRGRISASCEHPKLPVDPVDGTRDAIPCRNMRAEGRTILLARAEAGGYFCGAAGHLFEPKEPPSDFQQLNQDEVCMPGAMLPVGCWVENERDDVPDLITSDGVGGRTIEEREQNALRIAACWNALSEFETDDILAHSFEIVRPE